MSGIALLLLLAQDPAALVRKLGAAAVEEREEAASTLKRLGRAALPALEAASRDRDPDLAARARDVIGAISIRERLSPALLAAFPGVDDRLARTGKRAWLEAFLEAAGHPRLKPEDLGPLAGPALQAAEGYEEISRVLKAVRERDVQAAALEVVRLLGNNQMRHEAAETLGQIRTPEAARAAAEVLLHPDVNVRMSAVDALAAMHAREAVPRLLELLKHAEPDVRAGAADALGRLGAKEAIPALAARIREGPEEDGGIAWALIHMKAPEAAAEVARLLADPRPAVRRRALATLGMMERFAAAEVPGIVARLADPDPDVRRAALASLANLKPEGRAPEIASLLEDPVPAVRIAAVAALGTLEVRDAAAKIRTRLGDTEGLVRLEAVRALGRLRARETVPELVGLLKDPHPRVRWEAAGALEALRAQELVPGLRVGARHFLGDATAEEEEVWTKVHGYMGITCGTCRAGADFPRGPLTTRVLVKMARGGDIRRTTIAGYLGELGHREAEDLLVEMLGDEDAPVRVAAAWALGRMGSTRGAGRAAALLEDPKLDDVQKSSVAYGLGAMGDLQALPAVRALRDALRARKEAGSSTLRAETAVRMLEIASEEDPEARHRELSGILRRSDSTGEGLLFTLWALRKLAEAGHPGEIRAFLERESRSLGRSSSMEVLALIHRAGGKLSEVERDLLRGAGLLP